ncbi:DNA repair protein RecN [Gaiella sp.]|uniref:DNA repair protein RecN n=1 Tax=Gaiella sp. TaxID=2663207 RepID=UPI003983A136
MLRRLRIENLVLIREAELDLGSGLNVLSGETGAGKTIFAQAIGLLLGVKGDIAAVGPAAKEAYVEAEFDVEEGFFDDADLEAFAELRPEDEPGVVLARRVFADGRTRAYAWGRAIAREDLVAATERLIAMSGQFEQRRLARPAYQLEVLDAFVGDEQAARRRDTRDAWRALTAARRRNDEIARDAGAEEARVNALRDLVERTEGFERGEEETLRAERERMRHAAELAAGAAAATAAVAPEDGEGAVSLAAAAERALAPLVDLAPELEGPTAELRDLVHRLNDVGGDLHRFVASLEADPARVESVEERLDLIAEARRRFDAQTTDALLDRRDAALGELDQVDAGVDPVAAAAAALALAEEEFSARAAALHDARSDAVEAFAEAVAENLRGVGMGEGEFNVELRRREPGPIGFDEAVFQIRPNPGMPLGPVAETASGGELSRIALALAVVAGGETLVFDEIDAGIGGVTAHRVAETLSRLATRAQVITITHLPQIASVATTHFRVEKVAGDPTHTRIEALSPEERRSELERMLGGEEFLAGIASEPRS